MLLKSLISSVIFFVTSLAMAQTAPPKVLDGDYRVELTIGGKVFIDHMTLQGKEGPITLRDSSGDIVGTMIVPGMFTSPITGSGYCTDWGFTCHLSFSIVANENGKTYKVNYTADVDSHTYRNYQLNKGPLIITGTATLEDGSLLGDYVATKQ